MTQTSKSLVLFIVPLFALALLIGCTPSPKGGDASSSVSVQDGAVPGFDGKLITGKHLVVLKTSKGDVTVQLDADAAPKTATNFYVLSKTGYYNGLTFHRVIPGFVIQGGDPVGNGTGGASIFGSTFEDEQNDLQLEPGALAMANRGPNTNGSQFFIVQAEETLSLPGYYTVFGKVTDGMDVVNAIANVPRGERDMPIEAVTFTAEVQE